MTPFSTSGSGRAGAEQKSLAWRLPLLPASVCCLPAWLPVNTKTCLQLHVVIPLMKVAGIKVGNVVKAASLQGMNISCFCNLQSLHDLEQILFCHNVAGIACTTVLVELCLARY